MMIYIYIVYYIIILQIVACLSYIGYCIVLYIILLWPLKC